MKIRSYSKLLHKLLFVVVVGIVALQTCTASPPEDKRPLVLVIYADWCPLCQRLKPTLAFINEKYYGKIRFVRFDVTTEATTAQSKLEAKNLGLDDFFLSHIDQTSLVVIQDSHGHELFRAFHDYVPEHYEAVLDQQLRIGRK